ncbi:MAG TPA: ATP-binding protein, partial [Saprospiraceae bacterium]|nr:ATP-binding protein [Saprospiraceae bacterium]
YADDGKNKLLLATRTNGLLLYDEHSIIPFSSEATDLLKEAQVYCCTKLAGEQFAIGTLQNGILIIDADGNLRHHLNKASGLQDETIWHLYTDRQGDLWTGMHVGISRLEMNTPFTQFTSLEGVEGSVLEIIRHQGTLYIATTMGIFYLDESRIQSNVPGKFKKVSGVSPQAWTLLSFGDILLGGTFDGLYEINGDQGKLVDSAYTMTLHQDLHDPLRLFIGMQDGFKSLYRTGNQWRDDGIVEGMDQEALHFYQSPENKLWITTRYMGIYLADFSSGFTTKPLMLHYDTTQGLQINDRTIPFETSSGLRFATPEGVYLFDESQQRFFQDTNLITGVSQDQLNIFSVNTDEQGNLWMVRRQEPGIALLQNDKSYKWESTTFKRIQAIDEYYLYPDPDHQELTWIGCIDRVILYDGKVPFTSAPSFTTQIRQVIINEDSLVFGGVVTGIQQAINLDSRYKSLRIKYAAPTFGEESKTEYQYILEGYDAQWSNWTTETYKDYTGLPQGDYRFLVRSKNLYQQVGEAAVFIFKIFPPFYLTSFAFILYALLLCALIYLLWQLQMKRVRAKHQQQLELVEFEKLKELDQLKSRFFANISHEFKTPLTLILGPVDNMLSSKIPSEFIKQCQTIKRSAQRMHTLISQLLDLSKIEAGKLKLDVRTDDIIPLIKHILHSFESLAASKKLNVNFRSDRDVALLSFDREKIEQVVTNLISNAFKYTPDGGEVTIEIISQGEALLINFFDTGIGIQADQLPHVFDRFYQGSEAALTGEPGTGIGLALAKELVELHHGKISVTSTEHQGSNFTIMLPLLKESADTKELSTEKLTKTFIHSVEQELTEEHSIFHESELTSENTLLLVEDNPDMRAYIRESLAGNYRIIEAVNGQDGVEKAFEHIPDIIISDVMMPRMDGLQLVEMLKGDERSSHIPIILLTAKADIESRLAGLERGANDYLAKPFHRNELLMRTKNLVDLRKRFWERYNAQQPLVPIDNKD